jgi:hypothetical protein
MAEKVKNADILDGVNKLTDSINSLMQFMQSQVEPQASVKTAPQPKMTVAELLTKEGFEFTEVTGARVDSKQWKKLVATFKVTNPSVITELSYN